MKLNFILLLSLSLLALGCASLSPEEDKAAAAQAIELAKECVQLESLSKIGTKIDLTSFRASDVVKQKDQWKVSFKPLLMIVPANRATPSNAIVYVSTKPSCSSEWTYVDNRGPYDKFEYASLAETKSAGIVNYSRDERLVRLAPLRKALGESPSMSPVMDEVLSDSTDLTGSLLVLEREGYWYGHLFEIPRSGNSSTSGLRSFWFRFDPKTSKITELKPSK